jgi:hypothetical protein
MLWKHARYEVTIVTTLECVAHMANVVPLGFRHFLGQILRVHFKSSSIIVGCDIFINNRHTNLGGKLHWLDHIDFNGLDNVPDGEPTFLDRWQSHVRTAKRNCYKRVQCSFALVKRR